MCTFRRWDSSAQIKWECYPQLRDCLPACLPGRLYCLWTVGRWTAPELMSPAKGGSENMHTCCSRSNKTPTAWYSRENITAEATSDHIWKFLSIYFNGQQSETVDLPEYQTVCSFRRFLKENSTNFRHEDQFTRCENSCIMSTEDLDACSTIWYGKVWELAHFALNGSLMIKLHRGKCRSQFLGRYYCRDIRFSLHNYHGWWLATSFKVQWEVRDTQLYQTPTLNCTSAYF